MNYYGYRDFEEHFWSPQEVCGQTSEGTAKAGLPGFWKWLGNQFGLMFGVRSTVRNT